MNVKDFSYIVAVVDHGSYSRAAEALFLSQPSLSAYIKNLEKQMGFRFFEDDKKTLSPEGELYISYARKIIALDQSLTRELSQMQRVKNKKIRVGLTIGRSEHFLDELYNRFKMSDSICDIDICVDITHRLLEKLASRELDVILMNQGQDIRGFSSQVIFTDNLLLAAHKDHFITRQAYRVENDPFRHLPPEALREKEYITFPKGRTLRAAFDRFCQEEDICPIIVQEVPNMRAICKMVSHNNGLAFVFNIPHEIAGLGKNCECFHVDTDKLDIDYLLLYSSEKPLSKEYKKAIHLIKETIIKCR